LAGGSHHGLVETSNGIQFRRSDVLVRIAGSPNSHTEAMTAAAFASIRLITGELEDDGREGAISADSKIRSGEAECEVDC
jgi:hypothetical protein